MGRDRWERLAPDLSGLVTRRSGTGISGTVEFGRVGSPGKPGVGGGGSEHPAGCGARILPRGEIAVDLHRVDTRLLIVR